MSRFVKKMIVFCTLLYLVTSGANLFAQEETPADDVPAPVSVTHILGDQAISFGLGAFIPLFFVRLADGTVEATNLSLGAKGSIQYMTYLSNDWILAFELCGALAFTPNWNIYWALPINAKISYVLYLGQFQLFLTIGLGVNFQSFLGFSRMDFIMRPEFAFYFPLDPTLELGLTTSYWFNPQFANAEPTQSGQSRLGNFLDVSVSLIYHF